MPFPQRGGYGNWFEREKSKREFCHSEPGEAHFDLQIAAPYGEESRPEGVSLSSTEKPYLTQVGKAWGANVRNDQPVLLFKKRGGRGSAFQYRRDSIYGPKDDEKSQLIGLGKRKQQHLPQTHSLSGIQIASDGGIFCNLQPA